MLSALSPSDRPFGWIVGVGGGVLGLVGAVRRWPVDRAARLVVLTAAVLVPATVFFGREYWGLTFGVALACFAPAARRPRALGAERA